MSLLARLSFHPRAWLLTVVLALAGGMADPTDINQGLTDFAAGRFAEAIAAWQQAAAAGDANGDLYMGVAYDTGQGVSQDYQAALDWYRRAAQAGSSAGAFNVGVFYDAGLGVPQSQREAAVWYGRAAAAGFPRAQYNLALLYEEGAGVRRDRRRAVTLFRQAAAQGLTAARAHLASLGERFSASQVPPAENPVADFQRAQDAMLKRGPAETARVAALFRHAADRHNALAEYDLGYFYEHGVGVSPDAIQAYVWYQRALADSHDSGLQAIAKASATKLERQIATERKAAPAAPDKSLGDKPPGE